MVDLHLVSWNRPQMTNIVIRSIHRNTKRSNFKLHVLDNGSDKQTTDMLRQMLEIGLIDSCKFLKENMGLEVARQFLFENHTENYYFICIDNDCLPMPIVDGKDWIERLTDLMDKYEDYGAISCRTQVMIGTGNIYENTEKQDITDFPHPGGSLRIMLSSAVEEVGGWDRESFGRGAEERFICGKLRDAGYKTGFATHVPTLHLFGTRSEGHETDRWGYDINLKPEDTGHSDIWHPALGNGDSLEDVLLYAGPELTEVYFA